MGYLLFVSLLWAFSFGLIKTYLVGLDSNFVSFARLALSFLIFIPFLRTKNISLNLSGKLIAIGALQYGVMYLSYIFSYQFLKSYEVALFTIFTPLYISIINDIFEKRFNKLHFIKALIAITGAAVITYNGSESENLIKGFLIIQVSNLAFGSGQIIYKKTLRNIEVEDKNIFAFLYLGAVILTAVFSGIFTDYSTLVLKNEQIYTLLYLGIVASGLGFFLWNFAARRTDTGTLAVSNNIVIPVAVLVSLIIFGETVDIIRLLIGGSIITFALFFGKKISFQEK